MKNLFKTTVAAVAGVTLGLLFAKKSGKQLRTKLAESDTPLKDLVEELKGVANESKDFAAKQVKESDLGLNAESTVDTLLNKAKEALGEAKKVIEEAGGEVLEELAETKTDLQESAAELKKTAQKTVRKFKNEVEND